MTSCDALQPQWQYLLQIVTYVGTSWACCGNLNPPCIQNGRTGGCTPHYNGLIQCVKVDQATGCGENSNPGCGVYQGPYGSYGVQTYHGSGLVSLNQTSLQEGVLLNWPRLGYDNSVALCCGNSGCRLLTIQYLLTFYCNSDEIMLKCGGDTLHGICSIWRDTELGEYLLVNADIHASVSQSGIGTATSTLSVASPITSTSSIGSSSPSNSGHSKSLSVVGIALGSFAGVVALSICFFLVVRVCRRHRAHARSMQAMESSLPVESLRPPVLQPLSVDYPIFATTQAAPAGNQDYPNFATTQAAPAGNQDYPIFASTQAALAGNQDFSMPSTLLMNEMSLGSITNHSPWVDSPHHSQKPPPYVE